MKTRICLLAVALCVPLFAQSFIYVLEPTNPEPATPPKYLLMHRYWGTVNQQRGDAMLMSQGWVKLTETFDTADELKARLDDLVQRSGLRQQRIIGVWVLAELNRAPIVITETVKTTPVRIEERKEIERHWKLDFPKKD